MKKHVFLFGLLGSILIFLFSQCQKKSDDAYRFKFQFLTENYKPLNYIENTTVTGLAPDILKEICKQLNIPFEVQVLPWDEAYDFCLLYTSDAADE